MAKWEKMRVSQQKLGKDPVILTFAGYVVDKNRVARRRGRTVEE
jgi:hypothetical protein